MAVWQLSAGSVGSSLRHKCLFVMGIIAVLTDGVWAQDPQFERNEIDIRKTKCEVCKTAVKILFKEVESTDPAKVVEVGSFRLQADGTTQQRKVPYRGSEVQLHDLLDDGKVCGGMKDYVPVTDKESGLPTMINMVEDMDKMHKVKFNPNPEFNSKMNTFCEEMVGDHEDTLMTLFKRNIQADGIKTTPYNFGKQFCIHTTQLCDADDKMETLKPKDSPTSSSQQDNDIDEDVANFRNGNDAEDQAEPYDNSPFGDIAEDVDDEEIEKEEL